MLEGKNQSVIVSGESGAGKTQSTKYIMEYLAQVDALSKIDSLEALMRPETMTSQHKSETEDAVLASNPILEVLKERNYHIFYQLCSAAPAAEKEQLGLDKWESFHYLNQGRAGVVKNMNDVEEFKATQEALSTLGMSVSTQWNIFRLCAALLHIGNIKIIDSEARVEASEISVTDPALAKGCELLGIDAKEFVKWVTKKQTVIGRDKYEKDIKKDAAIVARDSVTKVIYTKLFDWLVKSINKNLKRESNSEQHFIGVLDIYG
ncbi:Myosin type-2 heavy chain 1, partial [Rhizoclosmatium hyalinum]